MKRVITSTDMKYYVIEFETFYRHGYFGSWTEADDYAQRVCDGEDYTIEEWDSEEEYEQNLG